MNIIFDIGDVLLDWSIDIMLEHISSPADREKALKGIIEHDDWLELDRGRMEMQTAIERAVKRTGLDEVTASRMMESISRSLVPNPDAIAILDQIDRSRHRLFCLSNLHRETWEEIYKLHHFWNRFEGILISFQTGYIKPEIEMYMEMLKRFKLDAADCLFIDDRPANVAGAEAAGIKCILFKNADDCRTKLKKYLITADV